MLRCRATYLTAFALALWAGLFFTPYFPFAAAGAAALGLCAPGLALLGLSAPSWKRAAAGLLAAGLGLAVAAVQLAPLRASSGLGGLPEGQVRGFAGELSQDSSPAAGGAVRYRVRLRRVWSGAGELRAAGAGEVELTVPGGGRLHWGRRVLVRGELRRVGSQTRPRFTSRVEAEEVQVQGYSSALLRGRARLHGELERRLAALGPGPGGLLAALLLGNRAGVPEAQRALFQDSGSLHLLALSGLHAAILFGVASFLLSWVRDRRVRAAAGALLLAPYLFLAGANPSLTRAVVMLAAGALGFVLDRDRQALNLLALAAAVVLLADPRSAAELSFQLSFLALLGIALLGPVLYRLFTPPLPRFLGSALSISVGAQAATAPLLLSCFGAAYPAGVLAALPLIPMVTAFLWGGLASLALSLLPGPPLLAAPLGLLHRAILGCLGLFARIPPARAAWQPWFWAPVAAGFAALLLVKLRAGRAA